MIQGQALTFETFGLNKGVMTMRDRETGTVWTQLDGKAISGQLSGERLTMIPMPQMTWGEWITNHPDTLVLSPNTPFIDRYRAVNTGSFNPNEAIYGDDRMDSNALIIGVEVEGIFKGYPISEFPDAGGAINDTVGGHPIVALYDGTSQTGLAYSSVLNGQTLEFYTVEGEDFAVRDKQTESTWDAQGNAISGSLAGNVLEFVPSFISEWYGWSGYHPETQIFAQAP